MPRPSVIPGIKARSKRTDQERGRVPDSAGIEPHTDHAEHFLRMARSTCGQSPWQSTSNEPRKYLYERKELTDLVNCIAEGQGLASIGSRLHQEVADKTIKQRLAQQAKSAQDATQAAVEAAAAQQELLERIADLSAELAEAKAENTALRAQLEADQRWAVGEPRAMNAGAGFGFDQDVTVTRVVSTLEGRHIRRADTRRG